MGPFTFYLPWVMQDVIVIIISLALVFFIIKNEEHPVVILTEMFCFVFLYASVYENGAAYAGMYGYGRSVLMIFNVPLTVPLVEYIVVYASLRMSGAMKMPVWLKPVFAGAAGMVYDFSLDPLSVTQVFAGVHETAIGRWTWFPLASDPVIFGIPVFNFTGWFILCCYAAATLLIGRFLYAKSGCRAWVGFAYPVIAMDVSLGILISPVSWFLLWLGPFMPRGSVSQWIMLIFYIVCLIALYFFVWKGKMRSEFTFRNNWPAWYVLFGTHIINIIFALAEKQYAILGLQAGTLAAGCAMLLPPFLCSRRQRLS